MFIADAQIEARCAELWREHLLEPGFDVERLLDDLDLRLLWQAVPDGDGSKVLGQFVPARRQVILNERHQAALEAKGGRLRRFTVAHEIGHAVLHGGDMATTSLFDGDRVWCRDRSRDPIEIQAERFAAALLVPRDQLQAAVPDSNWRGWPAVYALADRFMVNVSPMRIRLEGLGWMHLDSNGMPVSGPATPEGQDSLFS